MLEAAIVTVRGTTPDATPAIAELDGITLDRLHPDHAGLVVGLLRMRGHAQLLDLVPEERNIASLIQTMAGQPWSLPMIAVRDGECVGVAASVLADVKSLNASLLTMFVEPGESTLPLAMMLRQLYWTFPLHRLHIQIPDMDLTREYVDLLTSVGFDVEGRLVDHLIAAGRPFDVIALGQCRADFEAWCDIHEPRLRLEA